MVLPQYLYNAYKKLSSCSVVKSHRTSEYALYEMDDIINSAFPSCYDTEGNAQKDLIRTMYLANQTEFIKYITNSSNKLNALILWTESRRIVLYFKLNGIVNIIFDDKTKKYKTVLCKPNLYSDMPHKPTQQTTSLILNNVRKTSIKTAKFADYRILQSPNRLSETTTLTKNATLPTNKDKTTALDYNKIITQLRDDNHDEKTDSVAININPNNTQHAHTNNIAHANNITNANANANTNTTNQVNHLLDWSNLSKIDNWADFNDV